jgi:hypothetical protein
MFPMLALLALLPAAALAHDGATPKAGASCLVGYVESGAYYKPLASSRGGAIERKGSSCPSGYRQDGGYCVPLDGSRPR